MTLVGHEFAALLLPGDGESLPIESCPRFIW